MFFYYVHYIKKIIELKKIKCTKLFPEFLYIIVQLFVPVFKHFIVKKCIKILMFKVIFKSFKQIHNVSSM